MSLVSKIKRLFDPVDLTKGNILKIIVPFLIPIVLSALFQQLYSLTDTVIVGKTLNPNEVAGVNDVVSMAGLVLNFTIGCTAGFSVIMSRAIGAKDAERTRKSLFVQILLSFLVSLVLTAISYLMIDTLLSWIRIYPSQSDANMQEIYIAARTYLRVIFLFGILSQMMYNLFTSILRGIGDSFIPFLFLIASTLLNIGLDLLFILVFHWGVRGSAIATVLSEAIAALAAFLYLQLRYPQLRFRKEDMHVDFPFVIQHLRLGIPLGFQWSILFIGIVIMQAAVIPFDMDPNGIVVLGNPAQVGYGVSNKLGGFLMTFFSAIGNGLLSFVSQNDGAKAYQRIRDGYRIMTWMTVIVAVMMTALGFLLTINGAYQHIFLSPDKITDATIRFGNLYLYTALPFYIPLGLIYVGRNFMQAVEKPLYPLLSGVVELLARTLICLFLPALINHGPITSLASDASYIAVCLADPVTWILSGLTVVIPSLFFLKRMPKEMENEI